MNTLDLLIDLTDAQRQAVTHTDGPLLVLAGAGSGKTRVITRRAAYLARTVTRPWNVLAITFTNKAAGEMRERITALGVAEHMTISTFHALGARLLRQYAAEAGISARFSIFDQSDRRAALKEAITACGLSAENWTPARVEPVISLAKNQMKSAEQFAEEATGGLWDTRQIAQIYLGYERVLARQEALDFDDLLSKLAELLRQNDAVRGELQRRFTHVLIDEYQDTNHAQYLIARRLTETHQNLCVTGDPDQSIYAWRGADIGNILAFEEDYPSAAVVRLEQNYRSTQRILAAASRLISANYRRKQKSLWTENARGQKVLVVECEDAEEEAEYVAERIRELADQGRPLSDLAIFYRINAMSRVLEDALRRARLAYQIARGTEFYDRKEIKDVLAYLRLLVNPSDEVSLLRIINTPPRGIGKATVERLLQLARRDSLPLLEAVLDESRLAGLGKSAASKVVRFAELMRRLKSLAERPVREILEQTLLHSGLQAALEQAGDSDPLDNVNELVSAAAEFDAREPRGGVLDWLHEISLVSDVDDVEAGRGAVTMMTLHAAKGLEYPVVFIVGLEDGLLPHARYRDDPAQIEEERRLCFVGMTRAKELLVLSHARFRMVRGMATRNTPSRFIREMGREDVELASPDGDSESACRVGDPQEFDRWRDGQLVRHPKYGVGRLLWIDPAGRQTRAAVKFAVGERTLILEYANLQLLGEEE